MKILRENIKFERGIDPKEAMGIGNELYRHNLKILKQILEDIPNIEEDPEIYASRITEFKIKLFPLRIKDPETLQFNWINFRGGMQLRTIKIPRKNWVNLFSAICGLIREIESIKNKNFESMNFERGKDPKQSMDIGKFAKIKKWLKDHDLFEDMFVTDDFIINAKPGTQQVIRLKNIGESLPEYIQFGTVAGGFDISDNKLITLRGCPQNIKETDGLKGNFKCHNNKLISLEGGPKKVGGNYICHTNPGNFTIEEVRKNCRIKGIIWTDDGDLNESMDFYNSSDPMDFYRSQDPKDYLNIGFGAQVKNWLKECGINGEIEYKINKDGTIDVFDDLNLVNKKINNFPYFIKFNVIHGSFYAANNIFTKLDGFPNEIIGDFSIYSDIKGSKKWKESVIRKKMKIHGTVWN